jgi:hypothetical protein
MLRLTEGAKPGQKLPQKRKTYPSEVVERKKSMRTQTEQENFFLCGKMKSHG